MDLALLRAERMKRGITQEKKSDFWNKENSRNAPS